MLDLDRFKTINDTHGHAEGDRVLRGVAEGPRGAVRSDDAVARLGGEEFALMLPGAGRDQAIEAAHRAREAIAAVTVSGERLTASAGVATCPDDSRTPGRLLELAARPGTAPSARDATRSPARRSRPGCG